MHACGHDGHTAMLLEPRKRLPSARNFDGTVHLIFQPAEENFGGAKLMIEDGLFKRFPCDAVFALHNDPGIPFGKIAVKEGPIMAAVDECRLIVNGRGGHGAEPQDTADPIVAGASIIMALQTVVSRNIHPLDQAVVTIGAFNAGKASNVIPERAEMAITIRSFEPKVRDMLESASGKSPKARPPATAWVSPSNMTVAMRRPSTMPPKRISCAMSQRAWW